MRPRFRSSSLVWARAGALRHPFQVEALTTVSWAGASCAILRTCEAQVQEAEKRRRKAGIERSLVSRIPAISKCCTLPAAGKRWSLGLPVASPGAFSPSTLRPSGIRVASSIHHPSAASDTLRAERHHRVEHHDEVRYGRPQGRHGQEPRRHEGEERRVLLQGHVHEHDCVKLSQHRRSRTSPT